MAGRCVARCARGARFSPEAGGRVASRAAARGNRTLARVLRALGDVTATKDGFALKTRAREVVVLALPVEEEYAPVLALLSDGEAWSSSALGTALGTSQRTVQRALDELALAGKVQSFGRGRARRWLTPPLPGFTTTLLLPAALSLD